MKLTPELFAQILGAIVSLLFSFFPGLREWFNALKPGEKLLVMVGLGVVVSAAIFGISCFTPYVFVACTWLGVQELLEVLWAYIVSTQAVYLLTRKVRPAKQAKNVTVAAASLIE